MWIYRRWSFGAGFYTGINAGLGVSQAITFFMMGSTFASLTYLASQALHCAAITRVMYAPMSFFETTPLGTIMNRFSKDIDRIDSTLRDLMCMLVATMANILVAVMVAVILIAIVLPWVLIAYVLPVMFYHVSAREFKVRCRSMHASITY